MPKLRLLCCMIPRFLICFFFFLFIRLFIPIPYCPSAPFPHYLGWHAILSSSFCWWHANLPGVDYDNGTSSVPTDLTTAPSADSGTREAVAPSAPVDRQTPDQPDTLITDGSDGSLLPSAPRDVEALIVSSRFVTLRWKEPVRTNGPIVGYSVFYRQEGSER